MPHDSFNAFITTSPCACPVSDGNFPTVKSWDIPTPDTSTGRRSTNIPCQSGRGWVFPPSARTVIGTSALNSALKSWLLCSMLTEVTFYIRIHMPIHIWKYISWGNIKHPPIQLGPKAKLYYILVVSCCILFEVYLLHCHLIIKPRKTNRKKENTRMQRFTADLYRAETLLPQFYWLSWYDANHYRSCYGCFISRKGT